MNVIEFVTSMAPGLKRLDVEEDISISLRELNKSVKPAYADADGYFRATRLTSKEAKDLQEIFYSEIKGSKNKGATFINDINNRLVAIEQNLLTMQKIITGSFEKDIIAEGMTAKKANMLRSAEYFSFITKFATDVLSYVYFFEAQQAMGKEAAESIEISPATIKRVGAHMGKFSRLLNAFSINDAEFKKLVGAAPDVLIGGKNAEVVTSIYPMDKLDTSFVQMGSNFIPNPIYHARMIVAEWQLSRYRQSEEKLASLKLRLLHLAMVSRNENSAAIEKEIQYTQSRVDKLERKLSETREELNLPPLGE